MIIKDLFAKHEPAITDVADGTGKAAREAESAEAIDLIDQGKVRPHGVGLRDGTIELLQRIADQWGVKRNGLMVACIRHSLKEIRSQKIGKGDLFDNVTEVNYKIK